MSKLPARPTSVNQPTRRTCQSQLISRGRLIVVVVAYLAITGAAVAPDASQMELIMYSLGSALAIIMAIKIIIKLIVYIIQAAVVLAVLGMLYILADVVVRALSGS